MTLRFRTILAESRKSPASVGQGGLTMNITVGEDADRKISARRDMVLIAVIAIVAAVVCVKFNLSEALLKWTRPFERLQLDELPAVLLVVAISLIWFSSRRYFEANQQLRFRREPEVPLAETLPANKPLAPQDWDLQQNDPTAPARAL